MGHLTSYWELARIFHTLIQHRALLDTRTGQAGHAGSHLVRPLQARRRARDEALVASCGLDENRAPVHPGLFPCGQQTVGLLGAQSVQPGSLMFNQGAVLF